MTPPDGATVAANDQKQAETRESARRVAIYFRTLREEGLAEDEAMLLTQNYAETETTHVVYADDAAEDDEAEGHA